MFRIFNFHLTDSCNFRCKFCFVKKGFKPLSFSTAKIIVDRVKEYFDEKGITDGRINIAGGEPLVSGYIQELIDYIYSKGIRVSIITNGYLLDEKFITNNKNKVEKIGISIDSINDNTNIELGRCDSKGRVYDYESLVKNCMLIKQYGIELKINVVASKINYNEDIIQLLDDVKPDRFKILQMIPITDYAKENALTDEEFANYCKKYDGYLTVYENQCHICNAYIIIDSEGKITTDNLHDRGYNIIKQKISEVEQYIDFNQENENRRYIIQ